VDHVILKAAATVGPVTTFTTVEISITGVISIKITQGLPNDANVQNASAPLVATVNHAAALAGVDWTVTCGSPGACGSFAPPHTAIGAATTFTAPSAPPVGNTVTITAASTSDNTKTASETVTVNQSVPPPSLLLGQWILLLTGKDANGGLYALGGEITGDGVGTITGGILDVADLGGGSGLNGGTVLVPANPKSTYSIGIDGAANQFDTEYRQLKRRLGVNNAITLIALCNAESELVNEIDASEADGRSTRVKAC
jgi:hypothetical protein